MSGCIVIPARLESTRLKRKLLLKKTGKELILHTVENAKSSELVNRVIVATDSPEIADVVKDHCEVCLTPDLPSGTSRVGYTINKLNIKEYVVNIQGDEPDIKIEHVDNIFRCHNAGVVTLASHCTEEEYEDRNTVKVVLDRYSYALYFSRSSVPNGSSEGALKHVGVYGYPAGFFDSLEEMTPSRNASENLEQLQWLENGVSVKVLVRHITTKGIDVMHDYNRFVDEYKKTI